MPTQNTSIIVAIIAGTVMLLLLAGFIITFLLLFQKRQQRNRMEKQQLQSQFAQTLLQSQLEIREQTLQHIARELHDNLGQIASLIKINLNTIRLQDSHKAAEKIENTKTLVRQLIVDLKGISLNLNSDWAVQLGLRNCIRSEVEKLNKIGQFEVVLEEDGGSPALDSNKTIILFRMVQEILNNAVKHSDAKRIFISLLVNEKLLTLVCRDNGVGFDTREKFSEGRGSGLINLRNRASLINASLVIESSSDNGTSISIEMPL